MQETRAVCIREVQKSISQSVKLLLEDKISSLGVSKYFKILEKHIEAPYGGIISFQGLQDHTADSIKSLEGYDIAYCEEAQSLSERSLKLLRPTIRKPDSELWFAWNPANPNDPIEKLLRGKDRITQNICVIETNWRHNPWFPDVLKREMEQDKQRDYDNYLHVWEGHYQTHTEGAIYAKELQKATFEKRITRVKPFPGMPVDTFWDLGRRDHTSIWFAQLHIGEYRIIDFYQNRGEQIEHYIRELQKRPYIYGSHWLPHDAEQERLTGMTVKDVLENAYPMRVNVIPRMSRKMIGINAARMIFPQCWFDAENCAEGIDALRNYKFDVDDETKGYSAEPIHDENSDAADAFAQLALSLEEKKKSPSSSEYNNFNNNSPNAWMGR